MQNNLGYNPKYSPNYYLLSGLADGSEYSSDNYLFVDSEQNATAIWGFNLPALYINTAKPSEYYGENENKHTALLSLGDVSYQLVVDFDDNHENGDRRENVNNEFIKNIVTQIVSSNKPKVIYSKEGEKLIFAPVYKNNDSSQDFYNNEISVTTPDGTKYYFKFQKYMNGSETNVYDTYAYYNHNTGTRLPGVFIFEIKKIVYPNASSLNFSYTLSSKYDYVLTDIQISDDNNIVIAEIKHNFNFSEGGNFNLLNSYSTVYGRINQELKPLYKIYYEAKKVTYDNDRTSLIQMPRVIEIDDLQDSANTIKYTYETIEGSSNPDQPGNVTYLSSIIADRKLSNGANYTHRAMFDYIRFEQEAQLSNGDNFVMYNYFVKNVTYYNSDFGNGTIPISKVDYSYLNDEKGPTLMSPYTKAIECDNSITHHEQFNCLEEVDPRDIEKQSIYNGIDDTSTDNIDYHQYPFGGGFNPWLDNLFFLQNKDDYELDSYITPYQSFDITTTATIYSSWNNPAVETTTKNTYDALQRLVKTYNYYNKNNVAYMTKMVEYKYPISIDDVGSDRTYSSYDLLPKNYNKASEITTSNITTPLETRTYNTFNSEGNLTNQEIYKGSKDNLELQSHRTVSYIPASETYPVHIQRLPSESIIYNSDSSEFKSTKYSYTAISNANVENNNPSNLPVSQYSVLKTKKHRI